MGSENGRVIVVGAGIAGLTSAFRLQEAGYRVRVVEQDDHVGGRMRTVRRQGFTLDVGAMWLGDTYTEMRRLIADVGLSNDVRRTTDVVGVIRDGRIHRFRAHAAGDLFRARLFAPRSKLVALRLLRDLRKLRHSIRFDDLSATASADFESARDYCHRRLNGELHDYLIDPMSGAWYFNYSERLSAVTIFAALNTLLGAGSFNLQRGVDDLPRTLAERLDVTLNARVNAVVDSGSRVQVSWENADGERYVEDADAAVIAVPANAVPGIYGQLTDDQRRYLQDVRQYPAVIVFFGLARPPDESSAFLIVPSREHPELGPVVLNHNLAPGRVPVGAGLVSVFHRSDWVSRHGALGDDELANRTLDELESVYPSLAAHMRVHQVMTYVHRWDAAMIARHTGDFRSLRAFTSGLGDDQRVWLAGDYFAISQTNSSLASGERAALQLCRTLRQARPLPSGDCGHDRVET